MQRPEIAGTAGQKRRLVFLIGCMTVVTLVTVGVNFALLYRTALAGQRTRLVEIVNSRARIIEAVARFDARESSGYPGGFLAATLEQLRGAHERFPGFGETGEFTLARREGDHVVFLLNHRHDDVDKPLRMSVEPEYAEPMVRALRGESGALIGPDYRGVTVLSAYEPVAGLDLGVVAKIDLAEVRAPLLRAGGLALLAASLLIAIGAILFRSLFEPLIAAQIRGQELMKYQATMLSSMADAMITTDLDFSITSWNEAAERLFGRPAEEVLGKELVDVAHIEHLTSTREAALASVREAGYWSGEIAVTTRDRERTHLETVATLVRDDSGQPLGVVAVHRDITEKKRTEKELHSLTEELEMRVKARTAELSVANKELETYAYSVSHDLKAPLRAITGFSEILASRYAEDLDEEALRYFRHIQNAGVKMTQLVDDLLHYQRLGRSGIDVSEVPLSEVLRYAIESRADELAETNGVVEVPDDLPAVYGSFSLLKRVFENLLGNSIKYRRPGVPPRVSVSWSRDNAAVRVSVTDNGIGIPKEHQHMIFDLFQRLHSDDDYPGTGVGLAMVQKAVLLLGGTIEVNSEVGHGTTFTVHLASYPKTATATPAYSGTTGSVDG